MISFFRNKLCFQLSTWGSGCCRSQSLSLCSLEVGRQGEKSGLCEKSGPPTVARIWLGAMTMATCRGRHTHTQITAYSDP